MDASDQEEEEEVHWYELCEELIGEIAKQLPSIEDFVRFGSVCQSWRSIAVQKHYYPTSLQFSADGGGCCLPWLMLRERKNEEDDTRDFFNLWNNKMYHLNLPETRGRRCWGSPYGWLITLGLDLNIVLLNPITRVQIHLPPQPTFQYQHDSNFTPDFLRDLFVLKVVIAPPPSITSSSSSPDRFLAMAIYSVYQRLAVASPSDKEWTTLDAPIGAYGDIICFKGQFFVVNCEGDIYICEVSGPQPPKVTFFASAPEDVLPSESFYLLDLAGELHMVVRMYDMEAAHNRSPGTNFHHTNFFEVYRLDLQSRKWTELMSFNDHALFVGNNTAFSVSALFVGNNTAFSVSTAQHPECKGNCVYFTDDSNELNMYDFGRDTGMFDFKDETVRPFDIVRGTNDSPSSFSGPVWITPNLW